MIQLPPMNVRIEYWILGDEVKALTPGQAHCLKLANTVVEFQNGYQVVKFYYELLTEEEVNR